VLTPVDLDHELGARLDELTPRRVGVAQVAVGRNQIRFRDLDRALDTALGLGVGAHARCDRDAVVVADLDDQRMPHGDPRDMTGRHGAFVVRQPIRRHTTKRTHRPIKTGDHRRQRLVPHREHDPKTAPCQPGAEQIRLTADDLGAMAPIPLGPHPRLHNPRPIHTPAPCFPVQLYDRERPASRAIRAREPTPDELVEHDIATHFAVGTLDPFLDLGHEPVDQLDPFRHCRAVGQQASTAHRDPVLDRVMRATREFAGGSITVRQRERFQDFHEYVGDLVSLGWPV
jgi:hypothetical protein